MQHQIYKIFQLFLLFAVLLTPPAHATEIEAAFSPGRAPDLVLKIIRSAEKSIHVAAYSFTSKPISLALLDAHKRGVEVQVVADQKSNNGKYSTITFLTNHGVPVRTNGHYAIMHNKFMIIDECHVETGSFNYTASAAEKNAENVIVLRDTPDLATQYEREWRQLWNEGQDVMKNY